MSNDNKIFYITFKNHKKINVFNYFYSNALQHQSIHKL